MLQMTTLTAASLLLMLLGLAPVSEAAPKLHQALRENRVLKGEQSNLREYPWTVALQIFLINNWSICTGSILDSYTVITAAHCVEYEGGLKTVDPGRILVLAGVPNVTLHFQRKLEAIDPNNTDAQASGVTKLWTHPSRKTKNETGGVDYEDIAVLRLSEKLIYGQAVQPIQLDCQEEVQVGHNVTIIGFGLTKLKNVTDEHWGAIHHSNKRVVSCDPLIEMQKNDSHYFPFYQHMICVQEIIDVGMASGDSGGPLVRTDDESAESRLVGVNSGNYAFNDNIHKMDVYVNVSHNCAWIKQSMWKEPEKKNPGDSVIKSGGKSGGTLEVWWAALLICAVLLRLNIRIPSFIY